jgi:type IV pilus assembly protein PilB
MVGEIRDEETASLAIHAALTGHLLLSTLHTSNTLGVIPRLIDMGVEPFLLPPTLNLIIAQRLVRKLCSHCKKKKDIDKESIRIIGEVTKTVALESERKKMNVPKQLYRPIGCKRCNKVGYSGRIGVFEVLKITEELAKLILTRPSEDEIAKLAKDQGMITMKQDGIAKVLAGFTSIEEVLRVAEEK